jgi:hypothetical protein
VITRRGRVVYIANPFFSSYAMDGFGIQKQIVGALTGSLLPAPAAVCENLPSTAQVTVLEQGARRIVHVLYYPLTRRAPDIDIIEEPGLLEKVRIGVRFPRPGTVMLVPEKKALAAEYREGRVWFEIPRVLGHQAVAVS